MIHAAGINLFSLVSEGRVRANYSSSKWNKICKVKREKQEKAEGMLGE